jgi:hypothetical protein
MVRIALILDPTLKIRDCLGCKPKWILSVEQNFQSSVLFYKGAAVASATRESSAQEAGVENRQVVSYENYLKRKRNSIRV